MNEVQVYSKIERQQKFFTLPQVFAQVLKSVEDPNSSSGSIAETISRDPSLTGRILKVANSSFYGRPKKVSTVAGAVTVLGSRMVKSIALSASIYDLCNRIDAQLDLKDYWLHSLEVAILSETIGRRIEGVSAEECFVCGLLHDIGILILDSMYPKEYADVWQKGLKGEELVRLEEQVFGTNHLKVGSFVASKWNLPPKMIGPIESHHTTFALNDRKDENLLLHVVCLATRLSKLSVNGHVYVSKKDKDNSPALIRTLGLTSEDVSAIDSEAITRFMETANYLEIDVGSPTELLQRANKLLYDLCSNFEMVCRKLEESSTRLDGSELDEIATDVMYTVVATFSHYFNNACATILGRSQLVELALKKGEILDSNSEILTRSIEVIEKGVESISNVLSVMRSVESFQTVQYHESARIIELKEQLDQLAREKLEPIEIA